MSDAFFTLMALAFGLGCYALWYNHGIAWCRRKLAEKMMK